MLDILNSIIDEYGNNALRIYIIDGERIVYAVNEENHIYVYENNGYNKKELFCYPLD